MNKIKGFYEKAELSAEKKAELKIALRQRFPQYADKDNGMTEVIRMNNTEINSKSGKIKVHSKQFTAAVVAAALAVCVGGSALAKRIYTVRSMTGSENEIEDTVDNYTTNSEDDYTPVSGAKYTEMEPEEEFGIAKTVYNAASMACIDIDNNGQKTDIPDNKITSDDIKKALETAPADDDNIINTDEFAFLVGSYLESSFDHDTCYYEIILKFHPHEEMLLPQYVYCYYDNCSKYVTYPLLGSNEFNDDYNKYNEVSNDFEETSAEYGKEVYDEANELLQKFIAEGKTVSAEKVITKDDYFYHDDDPIDYESYEVITPELFACALYDCDKRTRSIIDFVYINFAITFASEDGKTANGIDNVKLVYFDSVDMQSYTYPEDKGNDDKPNQKITDESEEKTTAPDDDGKINVPNVVGLNKAEAIAMLKENGLDPIVEDVDRDGDKGKVVEQSVEADKKVEKDTEVIIYVSTGSEDAKEMTVVVDMPDDIEGRYTYDVYKNGRILYTDSIENAETVAGGFINVNLWGYGKESFSIVFRDEDTGKSVNYASFMADFDNFEASVTGDFDKEGLKNLK